jgi:GT2 family glycosyltransferase
VLAQDYDGPFEVIAVVSGVGPTESPDLPSDPRLRLVVSPARLSAAAARNCGVELARGSLITFTDADVVVDRNWLARMAGASMSGTRVVAGSVLNGTPESAVGTVEYLVEFLDLHPARPPRTAWHGATCNLLVPRSLWIRFGPFPEDMGGGEDTLLTVQVRRAGLFIFAPDASVVHRNRTSLRIVLAHQYEFGCFTARLARRSPYKFRPLVRVSVLAPMAAAARVASLYARVAAWSRQDLWRTLRLAPLIGVVLAAWGSGLLSEGLRLDVRSARNCYRRSGVVG